MKGTIKKRLLLVVIILFGCLVLAGGLLYWFATSGGLIARQKPSAFETFAAATLVDLSIPRDFKTKANPIESNAASVDAGRALYQKNCEVCHGYDGNGQNQRRQRSLSAAARFEPCCLVKSGSDRTANCSISSATAFATRPCRAGS